MRTTSHQVKEIATRFNRARNTHMAWAPNVTSCFASSLIFIPGPVLSNALVCRAVFY